jgi:hypothetical protein
MEISFQNNSGSITITDEVIINVIKNILARKYEKKNIAVANKVINNEPIIDVKIKTTDNPNTIYALTQELRRQIVYNLN